MGFEKLLEKIILLASTVRRNLEIQITSMNEYCEFLISTSLFLHLFGLHISSLLLLDSISVFSHNK